MLAPQQVWLAVDPVDMRLGMDGLARLVQSALGHSPCNGSAYAFRNRRGTRLKLLVWDGTGVWLCQRRLHQGAFVWPRANSGSCALSAQQWQWLITGVDWQRLCASPPSSMQV